MMGIIRNKGRRIEDPGGAEDGRFARDEDGRVLCWDHREGAIADALAGDATPSLKGSISLPDGRSARPSFHILAERYLDAQYSPDAVASRVGLTAEMQPS